MTAALQSSLLLTLAPSRSGCIAVPSSEQDCISASTELGFALTVQPAYAGASGGIATMTRVDEAIAARNAANACDSQVMVDATGLDSTQRLSAIVADSLEARG